MSNIAFDFLTESKLFGESQNNYSRVSLNELSKELENYRKFIDTKEDDIISEIQNSGSDKFIQHTPIVRVELENVKKITKASIMKDSYILADPIYNEFLDDVSIYRKNLFFKNDSNTPQIKLDLAKKINYMKSLTQGVRCDTNYIKFFQFKYVDIKPNQIRIPNLKLKFDEEYLKKWFNEKLRLYSIDEENKLISPNILSKRIALQFEDNENMDYFICHYNPESPHKNISQYEYKNWTSQERIKSINDTYSYLTSRIDIYNTFETIMYSYNIFQRDFYALINEESYLDKQNFCQVDLDFIGLDHIDFHKSMTLRRKYNDEFIRFREKLNSDLNHLSLITDKSDIQKEMNELKKSYKDKTEKLRKTIINFNGISKRNIIPILSTLGSYLLTRNIPATVIQSASLAASDLYSQHRAKKKNPLFYLSKF